MRSTCCLVLFACACSASGVQPLTAPPDQLTALTYNMYYGLASDLLPEDLSAGSLSATTRAIINATSLTDFRCRIDAAASQIVDEQPDVIGLQEVLLIVYAKDLDDRGDDTVLVDFLDELLVAIQREGGPRYQAFQRENALIQDSLPLFGGIRIADRSAILVSPRLPAKQVGSITFQTLQPAIPLGGTGGVVVRGALHVQVPFSTGTLDLFNTHLQSGGDPGVRQAQATELAGYIQANSTPGGTIVLTGDLNDVPTSPTAMTFQAFLVDTYGVAGTPSGFTAYQTQTLRNPTDTSTVRIDYVFANTPAVSSSRIILNAQVGPCGLWPSDHFGVVSRFRTASSPPQSQRSE
jgi:endonuclease/exonuclease/phosphatase family metal-dependent hydrolase